MHLEPFLLLGAPDLVPIGKEKQYQQTNDAQEAEQSEPTGVPLGFCVLRATPNEYDDRCQGDHATEQYLTRRFGIDENPAGKWSLTPFF
jgi:hypothetical protein